MDASLFRGCVELRRNLHQRLQLGKSNDSLMWRTSFSWISGYLAAAADHTAGGAMLHREALENGMIGSVQKLYIPMNLQLHATSRL